jgi:hypothetical protein
LQAENPTKNEKSMCFYESFCPRFSWPGKCSEDWCACFTGDQKKVGVQSSLCRLVQIQYSEVQ